MKSTDFEGKNVPTVFIFGLNFVIQNAVLRVSRKKNSRMFFCGAFLSCVVDKTFIEVPFFQESYPALKYSGLHP